MAEPDSCASFDDKDKLVLRYSEVLTRDNHVDDALYADLAANFNADEILELAITVGMSAMVNRVHATFRTELDSETQGAVGDGVVCPVGR